MLWCASTPQTLAVDRTERTLQVHACTHTARARTFRMLATQTGSHTSALVYSVRRTFNAHLQVRIASSPFVMACRLAAERGDNIAYLQEA